MRVMRRLELERSDGKAEEDDQEGKNERVEKKGDKMT